MGNKTHEIIEFINCEVEEMEFKNIEWVRLYKKIIERVRNREFVLDAFFRVIQNTKYEEMMYKKPLLKRKDNEDEAFKGCIFVFFEAGSVEERVKLVKEYEELGELFLFLVKNIEMEEKRAK